MIDKKIENINISDLQQLIDNGVGEGKTLEYKSELNFKTADERKEFLADVSSFANCIGGDLIFGISENKENKKTNLSFELTGIEIENEDIFKNMLESCIRDSVEPRITDIQYNIINLDNSLKILILRIPASPFSPHRVTFKDSDKFYTRNSSGKYKMDVNELRSAFNHSQELADKIEQYKIDRLANASANRYGWLDDGFPILAYLAIPTSAILRNNIYSINELENAITKSEISAFNISSNRQITVDGIRLKNAANKICKSASYSWTAYGHCSNTGIIELYTTHSFFYENEKIMKPVEIIVDIYNTSRSILEYYRELGVTTPINISCAIINGQGFKIPDYFNHNRIVGEVDRELIITNSVVEGLSISADDFTKIIFDLAKNILDQLWNASGYESCHLYGHPKVMSHIKNYKPPKLK